MKTLIVYYSRTGHTRKIAKKLAKKLKADIEEIIDLKNRFGIKGWLTAGHDAYRRKLANIEQTEKNPANYDMVILGSPLWAFISASPAIRTYITQNKSKLKKVAFFLTKGATNGKKALDDLSELCNKKPVAILEVTEKELAENSYEQKMDNFIKEIKSSR